MQMGIICRTFLIIIPVQICYCLGRKLTATFHSDTKDEFCQRLGKNLLHVNAKGPEDSLHYLWNFVDNPSVLVALTPPEANLTITWLNIDPFHPNIHLCRPETISFTGHDLIFAYGLSIQKIYEFNDVDDTGNILSYGSGNVNTLDIRYFRWYIENAMFKDDLVKLEIVAHSYSDPVTSITRKGKIKMLVSVFGSTGRSDQRPSMLHSENSTQVDLSVENFETNQTFSKSRFAVEILFTSDGNSNSSVHVNIKKNLIDEHTPGVFKTFEVKTPSVRDFEWTDATMYLQWKPISYTDKTHDVSNSTAAIYYSLQKSKNVYLDTFYTILYPYYQERLNDIIVRKMNISFGSEGDDFYGKTGYNSWTFLVGFGDSLEEKISSFAITILSTITGFPVILIILQGILSRYRKVSN